MALASIGPTLATTYALMIGDSPDTLHFASAAEYETPEDVYGEVKVMYGGHSERRARLLHGPCPVSL